MNRRDFVRLLGLGVATTQIPEWAFAETTNEFYTVNVGTFANPHEIEKLTNLLTVFRFPVDYKIMEKDGAFLTRVGAGPYSSLEDVAFNAHALNQVLQQDLWIVKYTKTEDGLTWEHVGEVHTDKDIDDILARYVIAKKPIEAVPKTAEVKSIVSIDLIIHKWVAHYEQENPNLRAEYIYALIDIESNWNEHAIGYKLKHDKEKDIFVRVKDKDGNYIPTAVGLMQVVFSNFDHYCPLHLANHDIQTFQDLEINIATGVHIFSDCLKKSSGDLQGAYICYNGGSTRLRNWEKGKQIPAETIDHSEKGLRMAADYQRRFAH